MKKSGQSKIEMREKPPRISNANETSEVKENL